MSEASAGEANAQIDDEEEETIDFTPTLESGQDATSQLEGMRSGETQQNVFDLLTSNGDSSDSEEPESFKLSYQFDDQRASLRGDTDGLEEDEDDIDDLD